MNKNLNVNINPQKESNDNACISNSEDFIKMKAENFVQFLNTIDPIEEKAAYQKFKKEMKVYQDNLIDQFCPLVKEKQQIDAQYKEYHHINAQPEHFQDIKHFQYSNSKGFFQAEPLSQQQQQIQHQQQFLFKPQQQYQTTTQQKTANPMLMQQQQHMQQQQERFVSVAPQDKLLIHIQQLGGIEDTIGAMEQSLKQHELSNFELHKLDYYQNQNQPISPLQKPQLLKQQFGYQSYQNNQTQNQQTYAHGFPIYQHPQETSAKYHVPLMSSPENIGKQQQQGGGFYMTEQPTIDPFVIDPHYRFKHLQQNQINQNQFQQFQQFHPKMDGINQQVGAGDFCEAERSIGNFPFQGQGFKVPQFAQTNDDLQSMPFFGGGGGFSQQDQLKQKFDQNFSFSQKNLREQKSNLLQY